MRTPFAPRSAGHLARGLLLAAALCACGGEDDAGGAPKAGPSTTVAAAPDSGAGPCPTPPPPVDTALFHGQWPVLTARLREMGAFFPDVPGNSDTASIRLCEHCDSVPLVIRSDTTTYCTTPGQLEEGRARILGIFILAADYPGNPDQGWDPIPAGDSILMFASDTSGPATAVYRKGEQAVTAPDSSWMFFYCEDGHVGTRPQAQWRPRMRPQQSQAQSKGRRFEEEEGGSYGWMACASGCCQFYTPPPNAITSIELPEQANEAAPDSVPPSRPTWCPRERAAAGG